MKDLVVLNKDQTPVTTSIKVAEKFGKLHHHVMRAIKGLISQDVLGETNFGLSYHITNQNKKSPYYEIPEIDFTMLVMGFTGAEAFKFKLSFIKAFKAMEDIIRSGGCPVFNELIEVKAALAVQDERIENLERKDVVNTPKERPVLNSLGKNLNMTDFAKLYGMSAIASNAILGKMGWLKNRKLTKKERKTTACTHTPWRVTPKGKKKGMIPKNGQPLMSPAGVVNYNNERGYLK